MNPFIFYNIILFYILQKVHHAISTKCFTLGQNDVICEHSESHG